MARNYIAVEEPARTHLVIMKYVIIGVIYVWRKLMGEALKLNGECGFKFREKVSPIFVRDRGILTRVKPEKSAVTKCWAKKS